MNDGFNVFRDFKPERIGKYGKEYLREGEKIRRIGKYVFWKFSGDMEFSCSCLSVKHAIIKEQELKETFNSLTTV